MTKIEPWLERTLEYLAQIDTAPPPAAPPLSMALRERTKERTKPNNTTDIAPPATKPTKKNPKNKTAVKQESDSSPAADALRDHLEDTTIQASASDPVVKKLPKVILKLGPQPVRDAP